MGNPRGFGLHLILATIILFATTISCIGVGNTSVIFSDQERIALFKFRESVRDDFGMLSSWFTSDCCQWERVHCDNITGNVDGLHLRGDRGSSSYSEGYFDYSLSLVANEVDSCLAHLRHLNYLDLSGNYPGWSQIPEFIGSLKQLSYLNLSHSGFRGNIPHHIGNLSNLKVLDLSSTPSHVLRGNRLTGPIPESLGRLRFLEVLDLSYNVLTCPIPTFFGKLSKLDLSFNHLNGSVPESFGKLTTLTDLNLGSNRLTGPIPTSLGRLVSLKSISMHSNLLNGTIPVSFGQLPKLHSLDVSNNSLEGGVSEAHFSNLLMLKHLDTSSNSKLTFNVSRHSNLLNGTIPVSFGQLPKLHSLDVSNNSLEGGVSEAHFSNLLMLKHLDTSSNSKLTFNVSREWIPPFQSVTLRLGSCNITNGIPQWLQNQRKLEMLVLSNATISGTLPTWFQRMPIIPFLDVSHNKLNGPLTNLPNGGNVDVSFQRALFLEDNLFNESIPRSLCRRKVLQYLDLSRNRLTGKIPKCLENLTKLHIMLFSSNQLSRVIPGSIALSQSLEWLSLNDNKFIGELPRESGNLGGLVFLDLDDNKFSGNIPEWIGEKLKYLMVLRLHKNNFTGRVPRSLCKSSNLQILDVAYNDLSGTIPHCLGELNAMVNSSRVLVDPLDSDENVIQVLKGVDLKFGRNWYMVFNMDLSSNRLVGEIPIELTALCMLMGLNLSNNHLSGGILVTIGNMTNLESLVFSKNELTGMIPQSMAGLNFLSHMNLSHNNLSGGIPTGNQLQTLTDPSIYDGNKDLCKPPLLRNCSNHEDPIIKGKKKYEVDDESMKVWFCLDIMSGFATGFWGVIGVVLLKKQWGRRLFMFVEETMSYLYVGAMVRVAKMKRG